MSNFAWLFKLSILLIIYLVCFPTEMSTFALQSCLPGLLLVSNIIHVQHFPTFICFWSPARIVSTIIWNAHCSSFYNYKCHILHLLQGPSITAVGHQGLQLLAASGSSEASGVGSGSLLLAPGAHCPNWSCQLAAPSSEGCSGVGLLIPHFAVASGSSETSTYAPGGQCLS